MIGDAVGAESKTSFDASNSLLLLEEECEIREKRLSRMPL